MASKIFSAAVVGLSAEIVEVEAETAPGEMNSMAVVGLPDTAVSEARERVRGAIKNSGLEATKRRVVVNLAPADLKKHGPSYDLPIALSVLLISGNLNSAQDLAKCLFVGELALSGDLRPITGLLPIALMARERGFVKLFVPAANAAEAKLVNEVEVFGINNLSELVDHLTGRKLLTPIAATEIDFNNQEIFYDMAHVRGQEQAKRALEIAAAGGHNILMSGSPGSGKTLLARTAPSILPDLTLEEALEVTKIYSVAGLLPTNTSLVKQRPFRTPHHTASGVALVGGGTWPRPGEISLAHRGVLFLDEFAEFPRIVLDSLRQPLEDGTICISRAAGNLSFPAKFILIAAMNPCPCGFLGDNDRACVCSQAQIVLYRKKISGPICDRIDLHVEVPRLQFEKLNTSALGESSAEIKQRVQIARGIQQVRFANRQFITNSEMSAEATKEFCVLDNDSINLMQTAVNQLHLSARGYFRVLKLARTIADLAQVADIKTEHVAEALQYRPKME